MIVDDRALARELLARAKARSARRRLAVTKRVRDSRDNILVPLESSV